MKKHVKLDNAREPEQLRRMEEHSKEKRCHFCPEGFVSHGSPIIKDTECWFVTANDFPYAGSVHHYLIVSKTHITSVEEASLCAGAELFAIARWLKEYLRVDGFSLLGRNGNMSLTGATLDHLHFHFVVGVEKEDSSHPMIFGPLGYQKR